MATVYELSCDCGAVRLVARGEPIVSAFCHCESCRKLYGVEVLSASAWPNEAIKRTVSDEATLIGHRLAGRRMWRYHCSHCGRLVHGRNRRGYIVIPNERFREAGRGRLPAGVAPSEHFFYNQRVLDIADDLPKHAADTGGVYPETPGK
ncbi:GFA family protein [Salinisphaera sp.]|uniref:GFA family protein n=1 Tax=Salinisphaera sp. TaxID=1914330 RepID=UPI002D786F4C|nr:GFA family protein [Salinisphaera sp.]HET7313181.1 GFA family protein [Salinisphaera sp.]